MNDRLAADRITITRVQATAHSLPVEIPGLARTQWRAFVVAVVETDAGLTGYGLTGRVGAGKQHRTIATCINHEVAPLVVGMNPLETERVWHALYTRLNPRSQTGVWSSAVSALDIALWDIKGKRYGEPVWRLLGGAQNPVPAYITFGYLEYDMAQLADMAREFAARGADKLKLVVGIGRGQRPREDADRVHAVRAAVGDDVQLMIDANQLFSLEAAAELCDRIEECTITWFEEPVYGNDPHLLAELRRRTRIPITAGQSEGHRFRHRELLLAGGLTILQPNVCYVGGYTEAQKVAALAQAFNVPIANGGGWPHHNMHLQAGMANGSAVEFHVEMWKAGEAIYGQPPGPEAGWVTLTEAPGLGLDPHRDVLEGCRDD